MVVLTTVQNSVPAADLGAASAVVTFAHATATGYLWIAPTLGVGILLAVFLGNGRKSGGTTVRGDAVVQDRVPAA
ncbi:hypothetical protein ACIQ6Y_20345 [Streptomyces sp. NPDC096205]|uniref:hypothetical protein n=1 Tax=Streptomyces sp. NPDC096205 TaxID=3366081 RepID=UPI0038005F10